MAKPSELPTWATTLSNRIKPLVGWIASGFLYSERPPPKWVNWLLGMLCDWVAWFEVEHTKALSPGMATFLVNTGTYANNDYYDLSDGVLSVAPRTNPDAFTASAGGGDYIRLDASGDGAEAMGWWLITVELDLDLGGAATTANAVTSLELIEHASGSGDPTTGGTVLTTFVSTVAAGPSGRAWLRGTHLLHVTSSTSPRLSFKVSTGFDQDCTNATRRRVISVLQLSKDIAA